MKKVQFFGVFLVVFLIHSGPGFADDDGSDLPWKKGYINLGYYFAELDSSIRFGSTRLGIGIDLDMEELLGLDTTERAFRLDAGYRLGKTQRHKVERPVVGVGFDLAISPKWFFRQQADFFSLEIPKYKGVITDVKLALEYLPWKHFGSGVGFDSLRVQIEAEDPDTPGIGFRGNVRFSAFGAQLYAKAYL